MRVPEVPWYVPPVSDSCLDGWSLELGDMSPDQPLINGAMQRCAGALVWTLVSARKTLARSRFPWCSSSTSGTCQLSRAVQWSLA